MALVIPDAQEALPRTVRRRLGLMAGAAMAVFLVLLLVSWHVQGPTPLDTAGGSLTLAHAPQSRLARFTWLGSPWFVFTATAGLLLVARLRRDWFASALCLVGPASAGLLAEVIVKPLVDRQKGSAWSYPSGHTTLVAALAALVVVTAYRFGGARAAAVVALPAALVPLVVAIAVVRRGWHYPTDAAGGLALGAAVVLGAALAISALARFAKPEKSD
jgi:membrane-associated phospholipid phosphatase